MKAGALCINDIWNFLFFVVERRTSPISLDVPRSAMGEKKFPIAIDTTPILAVNGRDIMQEPITFTCECGTEFNITAVEEEEIDGLTCPVCGEPASPDDVDDEFGSGWDEDDVEEDEEGAQQDMPPGGRDGGPEGVSQPGESVQAQRER